MGRKKKIDRDKGLDATEADILEPDARSFTLGAVADRAGAGKGHLVYAFGRKDKLVHAAL